MNYKLELRIKWGFTLNEISYREIEEKEISPTLFTSFNRYQDVKKCWRKENGKWILKDIVFTEQWGSKEFIYLAKCLKNTIYQGGVVIGAFQNGNLVGFASIENYLFGKNKEYLQLSSIHISFGNRGCGMGKKLFCLICEKAKKLGAKKLYISAHSSEETQAFYNAIGCVEAKEYNNKLVAEEPYDCQLEYCLL